MPCTFTADALSSGVNQERQKARNNQRKMCMRFDTRDSKQLLCPSVFLLCHLLCNSMPRKSISVSQPRPQIQDDKAAQLLCSTSQKRKVSLLATGRTAQGLRLFNEPAAASCLHFARPQITNLLQGLPVYCIDRSGFILSLNVNNDEQVTSINNYR